MPTLPIRLDKLTKNVRVELKPRFERTCKNVGKMLNMRVDGIDIPLMVL
jgi:hypothetical protein